MSPVETWCHNINYYIPDEGNETKNLSMEQMARIRKLIHKILLKYNCKDLIGKNYIHVIREAYLSTILQKKILYWCPKRTEGEK